MKLSSLNIRPSLTEYECHSRSVLSSFFSDGASPFSLYTIAVALDKSSSKEEIKLSTILFFLILPLHLQHLIFIENNTMEPTIPQTIADPLNATTISTSV